MYRQKQINAYAKKIGEIGSEKGDMAGKKGREVEFARWPKYRNLYLLAFFDMLKELERRGKMEGFWRMGTTAWDVFNWWMEYDILPGQMDLFAEADEWED